MFEERDYQIEAAKLAREFFLSKGKYRPIIVAPTAAGKSLIIAYIAKELNGAILVLQPSAELLEQNYKKYEAVTKDRSDLEPAAVFSASFKTREIGRVTFATIGSIYKYPDLFQHVQYVIIDECHLVPPKKNKLGDRGELISYGSMYMQLFSNMRVQILGLTATAYRLKSYTDRRTKKNYSMINLLNREIPRLFNKFLYIIQPKEMLERGYISPIKYLTMEWDGSVLEFNSSGSEYTEASMKAAMTRNRIVEKIPAIIKQAFEKGRKACLVFVRSVDEARELAAVTPFSDYVHATTPKQERAEMLRAFKAGDLKTIFNVGVLTTGFDYPALDTIIIARPTMSLALFVQMIGRGVRKSDGKEYCSVLDMCENLKRFGKIEELRIEEDRIFGWVLRNDAQILSGRRLDELVQSTHGTPSRKKEIYIN